MIKRLSLILLSLFASAGLLFARPTLAYDPFGQVCDGTTQNSTVCQDKNVQQNASGSNSFYGKGSIVAKTVFILSLIIGAASVIIIIIAGLKFVLSGGEAGGRRHGDPSGINSARNTIIYAIIGLIIALSAQAIVAFVLNKL